jgi:tyrosine-protein kinase Etk/Wzc
MNSINYQPEEPGNTTNENNNDTKNISVEKYGGYYFVALLLKNIIFIILFVVLATAASVVISLKMPNIYSASVSAVPPRNPTSALENSLSSISTTLKDFGLTKVGGGSIEGYSYIVILQSRSVADSLINKFDLVHRYDMAKAKMSEVRNQLAENMKINIEKEGNYTITFLDKDPVFAAEIANSFIPISNYFAIQLFQSEAATNRSYIENRLRLTDSIINSLSSAMNSFSSRTKIFSPTDQAQSVSNALAEMKAKKIESEVLYQLYRSTYGENDPYTKLQLNLMKEFEQQINNAETKPGFAGNFTMSNAAGVGIQYFRLYSELETFTKVKSFLMPLLEKARLDEQSSSKNLYVLDTAIPADKKYSPKRSLIVLGTFIGSLILSIIILLLINWIKNFKKSYKEVKKIT